MWYELWYSNTTGRSLCPIFMPPDRIMGHIVFVLSVCLSVVNFNICYNFWTATGRNFIFGMHTPQIMPFQMTPRSMTLTLTFAPKIAFLYARLQTGRIMVWWCPSVRVSVRPSVRHSFPHFSPTCFDILIWNFVYHFIFMHVRSSSNAINFRHFLQELCSFLTSNSYKNAVFRTFLLHALTYWVQILYMTLF